MSRPVDETGPRLRIDPARCDGLGYCMEIVPELLNPDDWGYPMLAPGPIRDRRILRLASRAVAQCPRRALDLGVERER